MRLQRNSFGPRRSSVQAGNGVVAEAWHRHRAHQARRSAANGRHERLHLTLKLESTGPAGATSCSSRPASTTSSGRGGSTWSLNLGHGQVATAFKRYATVPAEHQRGYFRAQHDRRGIGGSGFNIPARLSLGRDRNRRLRPPSPSKVLKRDISPRAPGQAASMVD